MISEVYGYIEQSKDAIMKKTRENEEIIRNVKEQWIKHQPTDLRKDLAGIDGSWNSTRHHGYFFYIIDAVSVDASGNYVVSPLYTADIGTPTTVEDSVIAYNTQRYLESMGSDFEYRLATESLKKGYIVLIDNSALAMVYDRVHKKETTFIEHAKELINSRNVIFVAKTSESRSCLNGDVGDLYYFNKYTTTAGISKPRYDHLGVTVFYARLADWTPLIKVEVPGGMNEAEALRVVDLLHTNSLNGYPYPLLLAHQTCKISTSEVNIAETLLGLDVEAGAREVVGE